MINRGAGERLREALADTPVVIVQGPRQSGKTTLVQSIDPDRRYVTLDDSLALEAAERRPKEFLAAHPGPLTIDEAQRAPGLFRQIKAEVDRDRSPGRFLITGSSDVLLVPKLADSLAGRMEVIPLWPLSQAELAGDDRDLNWLFSAEIPDGPFPEFDPALIPRGGFPEPVSRASAARRRAWFSAYVTALIERDIRDLARIEGRSSIPSLLRGLASRAGQVMNASDLSRETGLPHTTLTRYLALLDAVFLTWQVPAWESGLGAKAAKTPRIGFVDPGVLCWLRGQDAPTPDVDLLTAFLHSELRKQAASSEYGLTIQHFRSIRRYEVPVVVAAPDGSFVAMQPITGTSAEPDDFKGLEFLEEISDGRMKRGFVIHLGKEHQRYTDTLAGIPITALWTPG